MAEEVHRDDRARTLGDQILDQVEIEVPRLALRVDGNRNGAVVVDRERGRDVRGRADEHLVSRADPERLHCEVERGRAARRRNAVAHADEVGELALERRDVAPERAGYLSVADRFGDGLRFLFADERLVDRDHAAVSTTTSTLSTSSPKKGPCFTLSAWKSSITWIAWTPWIRTIASPAPSLITRKSRPA